jgi:DNA-binding HxlR family transcriptional regulator
MPTPAALPNCHRLAVKLDLVSHLWRLHLLFLLEGGELGFDALHAEMGGMPRTSLSVQLALLRAGQMVESGQVDGPRAHYALTAEGRRVVGAVRVLMGGVGAEPHEG